MKDIGEVQDRGISSILDCLNSGVYVTDVERRIVFWNRTAARITGFSADEVVGRRCSANILRHRDKEGRPLCSTDLCPLHRSMVRAAPTEAPILVYTTSKSGQDLALSTSCAPVFDDDGKVIGGVEVFRDEGPNVRQMELARTVQRQMLTQTMPEDAQLSFAVQYVPRELVSGDLYHVRRLAEGRFAMFLADAAGHGVSAALATALVYSLIMECEDLLADPAALLRAVNNRAAVRAPGLGFFTAVSVALDARAGTATFCSAAHPPLLLQRPGRPAELLAQPSLPAGIQADVAYESQTVELRPGDRVLAFTDGVTDVRTGADERLGVDGLRSLVEGMPPGEGHRLTELLDAVLERCVSVEPDDDITLLSCIMR